MHHRLERRRNPGSLLDRYATRMGAAVGRELAERATLAAKQEAERAAVAARNAMLEAQSADRAKTEFLANMSHELRTPLNAIIGFSEMMIHGLAGDDQRDKHLEYAHDIAGSGRHLLGLINDILDVAKIESGKIELQDDTVEVEEVVESCVSLIKERVFSKRLELRLSRPKVPVVLCADERKLKQIVLNLLSNAIKFTPPGGRIRFAWQAEPGLGALMTVSDTGIGIAPEDIDKCFEPFTQVNRVKSKNQEGAGLGLPLCKALVELHGGRLSLESQVNKGTVVTTWFPVDRLVETPPKGRQDRERENDAPAAKEASA